MKFYVSNYLTSSNSDTEAINACLKDASRVNKKIIIFDKKDWLLTEAVLLENHTHILIDDCTVKLADFTYDNAFRGKNVIINDNDPYGTPIDCLPAEDIKIQGNGNAVISGPDKKRRGYHSVLCEEQDMVGDFWGWRTILISLSNCKGFEISNLRFENSTCWTVSFDMCSDGYIHDIVFNSNVKNGDGIDFRSGCHDCKVERISGTTSDDTVACTALYSEGKQYPLKNYLYTLEPSLCIQNRKPIDRNISNISITDVKTNGMHHGVICLAANGNQIHDISIENIEDGDEDHRYREATVKIYTGYGANYSKGDIHDITVKNVLGKYANNAFYCNADVENITLENIRHIESEKAIKLDYPSGVIIK